MLSLGWRKPLLCENSISCLESLKIILISGSAPPWLGNRPGPTRSEGRVPRASWSPSLGLGFEILFLGWLPDSKAGSGNRGPARDSRAPVSAPKTLSAGFCLPFRVFWFVLLNIQIPGARNSWAPGSRSEAGSWGLVQAQGIRWQLHGARPRGSVLCAARAGSRITTTTFPGGPRDSATG